MASNAHDSALLGKPPSQPLLTQSVSCCSDRSGGCAVWVAIATAASRAPAAAKAQQLPAEHHKELHNLCFLPDVSGLGWYNSLSSRHR